MGSFPTNQH